jgi:hypothetical protein
MNSLLKHHPRTNEWPHVGCTRTAEAACHGWLKRSSRVMLGALLVTTLTTAMAFGQASANDTKNKPAAPASTQPADRSERAGPGGAQGKDPNRNLFKRDRERERERGPGGKDNVDAPELTPEQASQVIESVREHFPLLADRLSESVKDNPDAVRNLLREYPRLAELIRLKKSDPKMFDLRSQDLRLEKQTRELVQQYRLAQKTGDKPKAEALKNDLQRVIGEHFTLRQNVRELELERLELKLSQLKTQLETRKKNRDALVQSRLSELTDEGAQAEW